MKVLLLTDADVFAGTEQHMLTLGLALRGLGVDVLIGCPSPAVLEKKAAESGLNVLTVQKRGLVDIEAIRILRRGLRQGRFTLIHAHNGRTALSAAIAARLARTGRAVLTQHFLEPTHVLRRGPARLLSSAAHRWVNSVISHFIAVSAEAKRKMVERERVLPEKITVIPNGISPDLSRLKPPGEMRRQLGVPEDAPLAVCVSRLEKEKDVGTLVRAMAAVRRRVPDARCVIVGEGSQRGPLELLAREEGVSDTVYFTGYLADALSVTGAGDIFVLASRAEPFGLVLLEAMALAKPVVATRAGGPLEIVEDGKTGLLVPPGDPGAMAEAMTALLGDGDRAVEMGQQGRERYLEHFTADRMARRTLEVYRRVLEEG